MIFRLRYILVEVSWSSPQTVLHKKLYSETSRLPVTIQFPRIHHLNRADDQIDKKLND
tara:strand:+ start:11663 stop:11836 length:174 start_codon:yes stop_codon:yes gene_type:complete